MAGTAEGKAVFPFIGEEYLFCQFTLCKHFQDAVHCGKIDFTSLFQQGCIDGFDGHDTGFPAQDIQDAVAGLGTLQAMSRKQAL